MYKRKTDQSPKTLAKYTHIHPKKGIIIVHNLSPVVVMKKIKLDSSVFASVTDFLPELTDADEIQDFESRDDGDGVESVKKDEAVQNEEVSFVQTLTQDELNAHVQKCLEMNSENKINQKNAFALKLIDCFTFLPKKKDFSAMACTLDAGAKIYSYRVDGLHHQVMKLADGVAVREKRTEEEGGDGETVSAKKTALEQRKGRKNKFIASSETLKRKMKGKDPKDKYLRFEALPGAILSGARRDANDLSLSLERYTPFWPNQGNYKPLKAEGVVPLPNIKIFREKSQTVMAGLPSRFPEPDKTETSGEHSIFLKDDVNHIFIENSFPEEELVSIVDIPVSDPFSDNGGDNYNNRDSSEDNVSIASRIGVDEVGVVSTAMDRLREEAEAQGAVNSLPTRTEALKILFGASSEYDYLNKKNCNYWAGPTFWKRTQGLNVSDQIGKKVPKKKKEPTEIVYDCKDLDEMLLTLRKKVTFLTDKTVKKWKKSKNTLPPDLKVNASWFFNLFLVENCDAASQEYGNERKPSTSCQDALEVFEEVSVDTSTDPFSSGHEIDSSSQDPLDTTFYEAAAAGQSINSDPRDPLNSAFYDAGPSTRESGKIIRVEVLSSTNSDFGESSMVPVPKMVTVVPIKYSTRAVRVDMRHLKDALLEVIREEIERDAREKEIQRGLDDGLAEPKPEVKFRQVLRSLPKRLDRRTREDLSPAIAVTAVLSLANEYSLQLQNCDDGDFVVRFPEFPVAFEGESSLEHSSQPLIDI